MTAYFITILLVIVFGIYAESHVYERLNKNGEWTLFVPKRFLIPLVILFCVIGGLRFGIGMDFYNYYIGFKAEWAEILLRLTTFEEPLIYAVTKLSRQIWDNNQFVIFVENAIIVLLLFKAFYEFKEHEYIMPLLLYMFYGGWLFSFNGVRQAIAVMIVFAFSNDKGKYPLVKYVIAVSVASLFHKSALLMLPILFFSRRKIDGRQVLLMIGIGYAISSFGGVFYSYMNATEEAVGLYATSSINILRVLVTIIPVVFIALFWLSGDQEFLHDNRITVNMTIVNMIICICTRNSPYMNRMSYYTVIYSIFLIPKFKRILGNSEMLYNFVTAVLFFVFFLYEARGYSYVWCL